MRKRIHVIIDGDNVSLQFFAKNIYEEIKKKYIFAESIDISFVIQATNILKYIPGFTCKVCLICSKNARKNSTDARILFLAGKSKTCNYHVIIVSQDKIYQEVSDEVEIWKVKEGRTNEVNDECDIINNIFE
tara:strand:- start:7728 stop:8123 length:396 start_codon:yes stop_codon:yes gene_type:complete